MMKISVIGAGTMGAGIAQIAATNTSSTTETLTRDTSRVNVMKNYSLEV